MVKIDESIRCTKLEYNNVINEDDHSKVYSRIYDDECELLSTNELLFNDQSFKITPMVCIWCRYIPI